MRNFYPPQNPELDALKELLAELKELNKTQKELNGTVLEILKNI